MNPPDNPPGRKQTTAASEKWRPATLGVIVNQYKRMVTIECRKINPTYGWQSRYYDHIIRNARSFENIQQYIFANCMLKVRNLQSLTATVAFVGHNPQYSPQLFV